MKFILVFTFFSFFSKGDIAVQITPSKNTLHGAVYEGNLKKVKAYLKKGVNINAKGLFKYTPLHWVKDLEIAKLLIEKGADVSARTKEGKTPLHYARNVEIVKLLLEKGADINAKDESGSTPLQTILDPYYTTCPMDSLEKSIWVKQREKTEKIARLLIEQGADVNVRTKGGKTPLHLAFDLKTINLLIEKGADVNARTHNGSTPLHLILAPDSIDSVGLIGLACWIERADETKTVKLLIKNRANVNAKKRNGSTPLHLVKNLETAQLLIEHGANVNARTKERKTPLHYARTVEMARLLLENGANINARDKYYATPTNTVYSDKLKEYLKSKGGYSGYSPILFIKNLWNKVF